MNLFNLAHDQELYAFEGRTNTPLEPNPDVRDALYFGWENGFEQGYKRALADTVDELRDVEQAEVVQRYG